jgi:glycosyltransferase involved in cell wall biosynthesis
MAFLLNLLRGLKNFESLDQFSKRLNDNHIPNRQIQAKISIIMGVKNEEKLVGDSLRHLLNLENLELEIIVDNDRSTDQTSKIIEDIKKEFNHLSVVNIKVLPDGWLGKVNALNEGIKVASGDFYLFMDPGTKISALVLEKSLKVCDAYQLDHLAILPNILPCSFIVDSLMTCATLFYVASGKPWVSISKRPISSAKGVGQFNLVRSHFFKRTDGFSWLKMEVADDVGVAQLITSSGGKSHFMSTGIHQFDFFWYQNVKEIVLGFEKNTVGAFANYHLGKSFLIFVITQVCLLYPFLMLFTDFNSPFWALGLTYLLVLVAFSLMAKLWMARSFFNFFMLPVGISVMGWILLRSSILCFLNKGIIWNETHYPIEALRRGKRIKFGV